MQLGQFLVEISQRGDSLCVVLQLIKKEKMRVRYLVIEVILRLAVDA